MYLLRKTVGGPKVVVAAYTRCTPNEFTINKLLVSKQAKVRKLTNFSLAFIFFSFSELRLWTIFLPFLDIQLYFLLSMYLLCIHTIFNLLKSFLWIKFRSIQNDSMNKLFCKSRKGKMLVGFLGINEF